MGDTHAHAHAETKKSDRKMIGTHRQTAKRREIEARQMEK